MPDPRNAEDVNRMIALAIDCWDTEGLIEATIAADMPAAFPDRLNDASFVQQLRDSATENYAVMRSYLAGHLDLSAVRLKKPCEFAMTQATLGIPRSSLQQSYRTGFHTAWRHWSRHIADLYSSDENEVKLQGLVLLVTTERLLTWIDFVVHVVDNAYVEREAELQRSGERLRVQAVRDILAGENIRSSDELFPILRYDVTAHHLAIRLTGTLDAAAARIASVLKAPSQAVAALQIRLGVSEVVIWLGRLRPWPHDLVTEIVSLLGGFDVQAAVSDAACGIDGFRSAYEDVLRVDGVRECLSAAEPVLRYADVRLEAMFIANPGEAARFVAEELGELAERSDAADRLRETVLASLSAGSHVVAAKRLGVHEHTVRNRLARVEAILGRPLSERRLELQLALRLQKLIGPAE